MEYGCAAGKLRRLFTLLRFSAVMQPPDLRRLFTLPYCTAVIVSPSKEHVSRLTSFTNVQKKYCFVSINGNNEPTPLKIKNIMPLVSRSRFIIKNSEQKEFPSKPKRIAVDRRLKKPSRLRGIRGLSQSPHEFGHDRRQRHIVCFP